jgi:hypothetical protein
MKPKNKRPQRQRKARQTKTNGLGHASGTREGVNHGAVAVDASTGLEIASVGESGTTGDLLDRLIPTLCVVTGAKDDDVASRLVGQAAEARPWHATSDPVQQLVTTIRDFADIAPSDSLQARLAAQMVSAHDLAMHFSGNAARATSVETAKELALLTKTFMRTFIDQIECWQKLKGATSQQKVIVEHVHVYPGGQAVVGAIEAAKPPGGGKGGAR